MMKSISQSLAQKPAELSTWQTLSVRIALPSLLAIAIHLVAGPVQLAAQETVEISPAVSAPASESNEPPAAPPATPDFDIDLNTEEFESFGEEGFQVEKELSPATETTIVAVKVAAVAAIVLLLATIAWKFLKR